MIPVMHIFAEIIGQDCTGRKHVDEAVRSNAKCRLGTDQPDRWWSRSRDMWGDERGGDQCFAGRPGDCSYGRKDANPSSLRPIVPSSLASSPRPPVPFLSFPFLSFFGALDS